MNLRKIASSMLVASACWLFAPSSHAGVIVVDAAGGPGSQFTAIQPAVDAAVDGDVILIRPAPAPYDFVQIADKALTLVADNGVVSLKSSTVPTNFATVSVMNLSAGKRVVLRGLTISNGAEGILPTTWAAVRAVNSTGSIWIDSCIFKSPFSGGPGISAENCIDVVVTHCEARGGSAYAYYDQFNGFSVSYSAAPAIQTTASNVFVDASMLVGGAGYPASNTTARPGDAGARVISGTALFVGCAITGGAGGGGFGPDSVGFCHDSAVGGSALMLGASDPVVGLVSTTLVPGASGPVPCAPPPPTAPAIAIITGTVLNLAGTPGDFTATSPVRAGQNIALVVKDASGASAFLLASANSGLVPALQFAGVLHVGAPFLVIPVGTIPPSGTLSIPVVVPSLPAGVMGVTVFVQGATCPGAAGCMLAPVAAVTLLDASL